MNTAAKSQMPSFNSSAFNCPHCRTYAHQNWYEVNEAKVLANGGRRLGEPIPGHVVAQCSFCDRYSVWIEEKLVHPSTSTAPMPADDMPADVKADYLEARDVFEKSPRSAGGLLRVGLEKLLAHLGATKSNPNDAIGELVKKGLVLGTEQQAMDVIRVIGNQSVHSGFVKLDDHADTVGFLFGLLNYIVEQMITRPKHVQGLFSKLPPDKLAGIENRDKKK